jgi:hypothetical protein
MLDQWMNLDSSNWHYETYSQSHQSRFLFSPSYFLQTSFHIWFFTIFLYISVYHFRDNFFAKYITYFISSDGWSVRRNDFIYLQQQIKMRTKAIPRARFEHVTSQFEPQQCYLRYVHGPLFCAHSCTWLICDVLVFGSFYGPEIRELCRVPSRAARLIEKLCRQHGAVTRKGNQVASLGGNN